MSVDDKVIDYIQGRMASADRDAFEDMLTRDADLRAEVTALKAARSALGQDNERGPDKEGWQRLSRAMASSQVSAQVAANDNRPVGFSLLQVACIAIVAAVGLQLAVGGWSLISSQQGYQPVTQEQAGPSVQIVFAPTATAAGITETLSQLGGTVIGGPGAMGIYTVAFPDADALEAAFEALDSSPAIVEEILRN